MYVYFILKMISMKRLVLCFGIVALSLQSVQCIEEETIGKLKELIEPVISECGSKFDVTKEQMQTAFEKNDLSSINSCFMACLFKHNGFINDNGLFDKDAAIADAKKNFSGEDVTAVTQLVDKCISVNDASVSDGDAGCDRAKLLFECMHQNKDLFKH